jgi:excisionase family DNA binding protein
MSGQMARQQVPLNEAAQILQVSTKTVWRRIKRGEIPAHKVNGQWLVDVEPPSGQTGQATEQTTRQETGHLSGQPVQGVESSTDIQVLRNTIEFLQHQLEGKDRQISELHVLLLQKQLPEPSGLKWWQRLLSPFKRGKQTEE